MDETYIKVRGQWVYLYRAVDKAGRTVDFFLSRNRDVNAAKSFLRSAMKNTRTPTKITLDAYAASHRAVRVSQVREFAGPGFAGPGFAGPRLRVECARGCRRGRDGFRSDADQCSERMPISFRS